MIRLRRAGSVLAKGGHARNRITLSALVIGALGGIVTLGIYGLFSATTQNAGNEISSGTVEFSDNDSGAALYNATSVRPGETITSCIKVTYNGSITGATRLYSSSSPGPLAQYIDLTITQGTQASPVFPGCSGFTPDSTGTLFSGTLQGFEQSRSSYAGGLATTPVGKTSWSRGESLVYRFQATLQASAPDSSQGLSSGAHSFVWEARSQ